MDTKQAYETMCALERRLPVNEYCYRGLQVWPYIKTSLYIKMLGKISPKVSSVHARTARGIAKNWWRNLKRLLITAAASWGRNNVCVLCPGAHTNVEIQGVLFNRSTYAVNKYLSEKEGKPAFNIEYTNNEDYFKKKKKFPATDLSFFLPF
ncbi:hypothetical protein [Bowmanella dokdonensis]|uniref:Uncharacterized protein n=1 Tax=Bowmanella dokdonensis TaxID=751969 RepID=A0A939DR06_9ALTE|nr:hypothetical protein [Bowmanella dokdonensis]MBN7826341.1 hypothetical protein [Bowmanella dokdonensis]